MSLLRSLDGTICTAAISAATQSRTASRPALAFLYPALLTRPTRRSFGRRAVTTALPLASPVASPRPDPMDAFFIQSLARAASCPEHRRRISTQHHALPNAPHHHRTRRKAVVGRERNESKSTQAAGPLKRVRQFAQNELRALVDYYAIDVETGPEELPLDHGSLIWNVGDDHEPWPFKEEVHKTHVARIEELLENEESPHHAIYDEYKRLPSPRVVYLRTKTIRALLHHLSIVERPDPVSMHRFLSILDDMKESHIHISRAEWTTAIRLSGRAMGKVSSLDVQAALSMWQTMEKRAGVKGGIVTMNVLFDIAVKAGKYALAEAFLKELHVRKLKIHRHFRVSLVYYHGIMMNGNAVRRTYQDLVSAGDVVDTVVMNAVISSLIRAGEPTAGEHVFERMKRLHASKTQPRPAPRNWREARVLGLELTWEGRKVADSGLAEKQKEYQDGAPIAPNARTYGLIIRHYAATAGNIDRVQELLKEMKRCGLDVDGTIFIVIMYGFCSFGGVRYSSWTRAKLEPLFAQFVASVDGKAERTWFSAPAVIVVLKAFKKCADEERTLGAWAEMRRVWDPEPRELEQVLSVLRKLVPDNPSFFDGNMKKYHDGLN